MSNYDVRIRLCLKTGHAVFQGRATLLRSRISAANGGSAGASPSQSPSFPSTRRRAVVVFFLLTAPGLCADPRAEFFEKHVRPVLVDKCIKCHGPEKQKSGLRLDGRGGGDEGGRQWGGRGAGETE